jgi:hypothetical protein
MNSKPRKVLGVRKLQRVGYSTITVSLPREWVDRQQLQAGDYVKIMQEDDGALHLEKGEKEERQDDVLTCPACGASVPSDSRFCKECGKAVG